MCNEIAKLVELDAELRGLYQNEFNIVSWCGVGTTEVKHSAMIAYLLNPREAHHCGDIPLKLFLEKIEIKLTDGVDLYATKVSTEVSINNGTRRLDILLKNDDFLVVIENKTESTDHRNQLKDYSAWLENAEENKGIKNKKLVYLTYYNNDTPNQKPLEFCHLSYESNIIPWLDKIKDFNIPEETRIAVSHYRKFLRKLLIEAEIIAWGYKHIPDAKEIIKKKNNSPFLKKTIEYIYRALCQVYCKALLSSLNPEKIIVSDFSLDGRSAAPFCCTYYFDNNTKLVFQPLASNGKNYGKLCAFEGNKRIYPTEDLADGQWNCNFFNWLDRETEVSEIVNPVDPADPEKKICLSNCITAANKKGSVLHEGR